MDRTVAGVVALALGLPYLSMIALAAIGSVGWDFVSGLITASVVLFFLAGALIEVKRLVDHGGEHGHGDSPEKRH
jgi:hypothetical protein